MDLGFGSSNQILGNQAANSILRATQAQEEAIQSEIAKYDALLDSNDTELEKLRERRLQQMKLQNEQRTKWLQNGHGTYTELQCGQIILPCCQTVESIGGTLPSSNDTIV